MLRLTSRVPYTDGQVIFEEGSAEDNVYVILAGSVEIAKSVRGMKIVLETLQQGQVFGELSFLAGMNRTATARAIGDTTLGIIDHASMMDEFGKISGGFRSIIVALMGRFRKLLDRASGFSSPTKSRYQKTLSVGYKDKQAFVRSFTGDISTGGLFIITENPMAQGDRFVLKLHLPKLDTPLNIESEVAWSRMREGREDPRPVGMGVKFLRMDPREAQRLKAYLTGLNPQSS